MQKETLLQLVKERVQQIDPNAEIILFGSRARGDAHANSDWDFLILTEWEEGYATEKKFWDVLYDIELTTGELITSLVHSKRKQTVRKKTPLYKNIQKEGVSI